jgi:hypothetical protein
MLFLKNKSNQVFYKIFITFIYYIIFIIFILQDKIFIILIIIM